MTRSRRSDAHSEEIGHARRICRWRAEKTEINELLVLGANIRIAKVYYKYIKKDSNESLISYHSVTTPGETIKFRKIVDQSDAHKSVKFATSLSGETCSLI